MLGNPFLDRLLNKSKIVGKIYDAVHRDDQSRKFELYIGIIDAMHRLADSRRQCLVVAFNKAEESYFDGSTYSNEFILQLLKQTGVEVVDVTLAERREELDPSYFIPDDGHPSDRGNQAKAGLLSAAKDRCAAKEALRPRSGGGAGTRRSDAGRRRQRRDRGSHGVLEAGPPRLGGTGE